MKSIVISLSGGMDSSTLVGYAISSEYKVQCVNFKYGSKHNKYEIKCAKKINKYYKLPPLIEIDLTAAFENIKSNLLLSGGDIPEGHYNNENMKLTVVPGRNTIFASFLYGIAESIGYTHIGLGVHKGDHCIPASEFITTIRGKIPIEFLEDGDLVLSQNIDNGEISFKPVIKKVNNGFRDDIYQIITKGGRTLRLTSNHKVYQIIRTNYDHHKGWEKNCILVPLEQLQPGDWILTPVSNNNSGGYNIDIRKDFKKNMNKFGESRMIQIKEIIKSKSEIVYDITVEDNHNFFAGTGSGILVSNSIYPDCREKYIDSLNTTIQLASDGKISVFAPFLQDDKHSILSLGIKNKVPYDLTRTCYKDQENSCGKCGSCTERLEAFTKMGIKDPIIYDKDVYGSIHAFNNYTIIKNLRVNEEFENKHLTCNMCDCTTTRYIKYDGVMICKTCLSKMIIALDQDLISECTYRAF